MAASIKPAEPMEQTLAERFRTIRATTLKLCEHLETEDFGVQSMPDVSPVKWHLAHTTWFFEQFILNAFCPRYRPFNEHFHYLFNSYYVTAGEMHPRPQRGLLCRPTVREVLEYRRQVDEALLALLEEPGTNAEIEGRTLLGLHHEQQHQELLLTDIKHVFSVNPLRPAVNPQLLEAPPAQAVELKFEHYPGGLCEIGADGRAFCFDNETPRHTLWLQSFKLASRLITNTEFRDFIRDGGYQQPALWLSDGWAAVERHGWNRPLYWSADLQSAFTLGGERALDPHAPVCHVSYFEADAYARWAGARLPDEAEWEQAASASPVAGNLLESGYWQPFGADPSSPQWFGDVWEWTRSAYAPYPGFQPLEGSLGEYNGKFMCNQMTVRGGSCVTSQSHIRPTYRSFFYPDARWQFLGLRLAQDAGETA